MYDTRKALVVGINDYSDCPLNGCVNDALAVADILERNGNGSKNFDVKCYVDNVPTKGRLKRLIQECFSGDADVAFFYFSGHGYIDDIGGNIVTPDFSMDDMGVSMYDILKIVNTSKCKSKIIVLDCCHSGILGQIDTSGQQLSVIGEGVTLLTACKTDESALEIDGHGVFTSLFLAALSGGAADITGYITPGSIYAYIDKALSPWQQRPVFKTNITRFTPIRKVKPHVSLDVLKRGISYFEIPDGEISLDPSFEPTNAPDIKHEIIEPYAVSENVQKFSDLQKLESVGLVVPCGEEHMYFAAMNYKSCSLTSIGKHYWHLVNKGIL